MSKPGRNEPCPCGSGKKFKHCHGAPQQPHPTAADSISDRRLAEASQRYLKSLSEFDGILACSKQLCDSLVGSVSPTQRHAYASEVFVTILAQCITLRRILPSLSQTTQELWDLPSICTLARAIVQAHDVLAYIALVPMSDEERELRIAVMELHDSHRRIKMLGLIGSRDPKFEEIKASALRKAKEVADHPLFERLDKNLKARIRGDDAPDFLLIQRDRCAAAGVDFRYWTALTIQLSQFVHTHPFAIHQMRAFRAGTADAIRLVALPVEYVLGFLSRTIEGLRELFPGKVTPGSDSVELSIEKWSGIVERGISAAAK